MYFREDLVSLKVTHAIDELCAWGCGDAGALQKDVREMMSASW